MGGWVGGWMGAATAKHGRASPKQRSQNWESLLDGLSTGGREYRNHPPTQPART